jgi:hypothetical protein
MVVILDGSICDRGSRAVLAAGWIPAFAPKAERLNVWYYSRGC